MRGAEELHEGGCRGQDHGYDDRAEQQREPDAVHALAYRGPQITGADPSGDGGGGGVREEDEDTDGGREEGGGDTEAGQLRGAEVSDDGAVGHHEKRLGDECAEGRNGQRDDLSVVPASGGLGCRGSLCHGHQSNLPQVRDAT